MSAIPTHFDNVTVHPKANVYFDGKVVSHTVMMNDGSKKTLGLMFPGDFTFGTASAEKMEMVAGECKVRLKGESEWQTYGAGQAFDVPANSSFEISVGSGLMEYICSYY